MIIIYNADLKLKQLIIITIIIIFDLFFRQVSVTGLFPTGEGAGYAGGIFTVIVIVYLLYSIY